MLTCVLQLRRSRSVYMHSLENTIFIKSSVLNSLFFGCVSPVYSRFINHQNAVGFMHREIKCTNIVPSLWVIFQSFTLLINKLIRSLFKLFESVNQSFSQLNHSIYNYDLINLNKLIIRGCV